MMQATSLQNIHRWDVVIRGGRIVDGTGSPWFSGDLAIHRGRIAALAHELPSQAAVELDARGCIVSPGFIDIHNHTDLAISAYPDVDCALLQGVTTAVVGNCGLTAYPLSASHRTDLLAYLSSFLPPQSNFSWDWHDMRGFYEEALGAGSGIHLVPLVGQGSIRLAVKGFETGPATQQEQGEMASLLEQALGQGAWGLSLGLLYPPGSYASQDELVRLATQTARAGGVLTVHIRNEGDRVLESVQEAIAIAEQAKVRLHLSHQKAVGRSNWGKVKTTLRKLAAARARGLDVSCDLWPYTSGSTTITALLPSWVLEGGIPKALDRLRDRSLRPRIRHEIETGALEGEALLASLGFDGIRLSQCPLRPQWEGQSLAQLTRQKGTDAERWDCFFDVLVELELRATMILWEELDEDDVRTLLCSPLACIGSDSWATAPSAGGCPHPRTYGAFPHFLRQYVLDEGLIPLEQGIAKITSLAARCIGLRDRGLLRVGQAADVTVFDPASLRDVGTFTTPHRYAQGVRHVLVDGTLAVHDGVRTKERAGKLLSPRTPQQAP